MTYNEPAPRTQSHMADDYYEKRRQDILDDERRRENWLQDREYERQDEEEYERKANESLRKGNMQETAYYMGLDLPDGYLSPGAKADLPSTPKNDPPPGPSKLFIEGMKAWNELQE